MRCVSLGHHMVEGALAYRLRDRARQLRRPRAQVEVVTPRETTGHVRALGSPLGEGPVEVRRVEMGVPLRPYRRVVRRPRLEHARVELCHDRSR
eukprot:scaffold17853_cov60-Phaeocystis_antarctica.AAC.1